jgi:nucleoside-diphosphate-sugar epimerase
MRSEFLFLGRRDAPGEDEQYAAYSQALEALEGRRLVVRTLDAGADKPLPYLALPAEENPFLGVRGLRLCLQRPEILRVQLRAALRAATGGPMGVMFPMVSEIAELRAARALLDEARASLEAEGLEAGTVEVGSGGGPAALLAERWPRRPTVHRDQRPRAVPMAARARQRRGGPPSDPAHPAVLRLIARSPRRLARDCRVAVCGEAASDRWSCAALGLGVASSRVAPPRIALVGRARAARQECRALAADALAPHDAAAVRGRVAEAAERPAGGRRIPRFRGDGRRTILITGASVVGRAVLAQLVAAGATCGLTRSDACPSWRRRGRAGARRHHGHRSPRRRWLAARSCTTWRAQRLCLPIPTADPINVGGPLGRGAAGAAGVRRVVLTSSAATIGEARTVATEPPHRGGFLSHYERSVRGRAVARDRRAGVELVSVNPASVQGPGRVRGTARILIDAQRPLKMVVDSRLSLVDVDDCARGHLLAEAKGTPGERYLLSGVTLSLTEALEILGRISGRPQEPRRLAPVVAMTMATAVGAVGRLRHRRPHVCREMVRTLLHGHAYDGSRATREPGLATRPSRALRRTIDWYVARASSPPADCGRRRGSGAGGCARPDPAGPISRIPTAGCGPGREAPPGSGGGRARPRSSRTQGPARARTPPPGRRPGSRARSGAPACAGGRSRRSRRRRSGGASLPRSP